MHGPYQPDAGHRFNPHKLVLDPYARGHFGDLKWNPAVFGYKMETGDDMTFDERDSTPFVPKCVVVDPAFEWKGEPGRNRVPWDRTVLYETHVRGQASSCRAGALARNLCRSGYEGGVAYIKSPGVTSIELLPIHAFINDSHLIDKGLTNYWGYNSIGFFAPDPRYASRRLDADVSFF